jgi:hypothetical protein
MHSVPNHDASTDKGTCHRERENGRKRITDPIPIPLALGGRDRKTSLLVEVLDLQLD